MEGLDLYSLSRMTDTTNGCKEEAGKDDDTVRHDIILACPNQQTSNGISKSIKEAQSGILTTDRIVVACDLTVSSIDALLAEISKHRQVVGVYQTEKITPHVKEAFLRLALRRLNHYGLSLDIDYKLANASSMVATLMSTQVNVPVIVNIKSDELSREPKKSKILHNLLQLAKVPNVHIKAILGNDGSGKEDLEAILDAYGAARCMVAGEGRNDFVQSFSQLKRSLLLKDTALSVYVERQLKSPQFVHKEGVTGEACIITGAAQGIGLGMAIEFARNGAKVVIADINKSLGPAAAEKVRSMTKNPDVIYCHVDVCSEESVVAMVNECVKKFGSLRILVNNAAVFVLKHLRKGVNDYGGGLATLEDWKQSLNTNVIGYANCIKHASAAMRTNPRLTPKTMWKHWPENGADSDAVEITAGSKGSIINLASMSSFIAQPSFVPYNSSKGAVLQMTKCCALDFAEDKIRVNCLAPGTIETPAFESFIMANGKTKEGTATLRRAATNPKVMKRLGQPEEIASAALFLASDDASFVTGEMLVVDGGQTIHGATLQFTT